MCRQDRMWKRMFFSLFQQKECALTIKSNNNGISINITYTQHKCWHIYTHAGKMFSFVTFIDCFERNIENYFMVLTCVVYLTPHKNYIVIDTMQSIYLRHALKNVRILFPQKKNKQTKHFLLTHIVRIYSIGIFQYALCTNATW